MQVVRPSIDNVFFFWAGDPAGKIDLISAAIHSFCFYNPGTTPYLFSNVLTIGDLHPAVARCCPLQVVPWSADELAQDTPFADRARDLEPEQIWRRRGASGGVSWVAYSDYFRYLALWRWGGTYIDLDDISVRPLTSGENLVPSSIPGADDSEQGFGRLARDRTTAEQRYLRLGNDPLVRLQPNHAFIEKCLLVALIRPPDLAGSWVMTEVYEKAPVPPAVNLRVCVDLLLHPGHGAAGYVRDRCGWSDSWYWEALDETTFQERWTRLLRLGAFSMVKNPGWTVPAAHDSTRTIARWICHHAIASMNRSSAATHRRPNNIVSVVIPSHRQRFLGDTLDGLARQSDRDFEVIVVENGFRQGDTETLVQRQRPILDIHYVFEERLGLNVSRNTGCRAARGAIIAFLDDDCVPHRDWIASLRARYSTDPSALVVAGRVLLRFLDDTPHWVAGEFRGLLSETSKIESAGRNGSEAWVVGANFSFRREVFEITGGFDEGLGMVGKSYPQLCHDETDFCRRASRLLGTKVHFCPASTVDHLIPPDRLNINYFEQRKLGQGMSDASLIRDGGRRPVTDVLDKLDRYLADSGWLHKLERESAGIDASARSPYLVNSIRIRVAYLNGLAAACLPDLPDPTAARTFIGKYDKAGKKAAALWSRRGAGGLEAGLVRMAQFMVSNAASRRGRRRGAGYARNLLGRAAFYNAIKQELVSGAAHAD